MRFLTGSYPLLLLVLAALALSSCRDATGPGQSVAVRVAHDIKYTFIPMGPGSPDAPENQCALVTLTSDIKLELSKEQGRYRTEFGVELDASAKLYSFYGVGDPDLHPYSNLRFEKSKIQVFRGNPVVLQLQADPVFLKDPEYKSGFSFRVERSRIIAEDPQNTASFGQGFSFEVPGSDSILPCNAIYSLGFESKYFGSSLGVNPSAAAVAIERYEFKDRASYLSTLAKIRDLEPSEAVRIQARALSRSEISERDVQSMAKNLKVDPKLVRLLVKPLNRAILANRE